ncbi:MAG TPA: oxaloacetate decarboxylase [Syntrophorhabdaceae bacterium]|nr:oxaloacetate decarboxylase [Syntrophorhabdaceae bacterium]
MKKTTLFRQLINAPGILQLPCCHDALSARVLEQAGFKAISAAGYGTAGSTLGLPDIGLATATEMINNYRHICNAVNIPVFVDIDTGFGDVNNAIRAVQDCEQAGAAGLFIEDQTYPKRCGHMAGKSVVPTEEYLPKLRAALWARKDPDFVIMARTDATAVYGVDDAINRARLYASEGADMVFVEAIKTEADMIKVIKAMKEVGVPVMANMIEGGESPFLTAVELERIGFSVVAYPCASLYVAVKALQKWAQHLKGNGTTEGMWDQMLTFKEYFDFIGATEIRERENIFQRPLKKL